MNFKTNTVAALAVAAILFAFVCGIQENFARAPAAERNNLGSSSTAPADLHGSDNKIKKKKKRKVMSDTDLRRRLVYAQGLLPVRFNLSY